MEEETLLAVLFSLCTTWLVWGVALVSVMQQKYLSTFCNIDNASEFNHKLFLSMREDQELEKSWVFLAHPDNHACWGDDVLKLWTRKNWVHWEEETNTNQRPSVKVNRSRARASAVTDGMWGQADADADADAAADALVAARRRAVETEIARLESQANHHDDDAEYLLARAAFAGARAARARRFAARLEVELM